MNRDKFKTKLCNLGTGSRYLVLSPLPLQLHPIRRKNNSIKKPTFDLRAFGKYLYIAQRQIYKTTKDLDRPPNMYR